MIEPKDEAKAVDAAEAEVPTPAPWAQLEAAGIDANASSVAREFAERFRGDEKRADKWASFHARFYAKKGAQLRQQFRPLSDAEVARQVAKEMKAAARWEAQHAAYLARYPGAVNEPTREQIEAARKKRKAERDRAEADRRATAFRIETRGKQRRAKEKKARAASKGFKPTSTQDNEGP